MARPLSFGIELEFALAYVPNNINPHPWPHETRCTRFTPTADDWRTYSQGWLYDTFSTRDNFEDNPIASAQVYQETIERTLRHALRRAGYPVNISRDDRGNIDRWDVKNDVSNGAPEGESQYSYAQIEVVSPAYYYAGDAKQAIKNVCALLANSYCVNTNSTTGFHVHIGNGLDGFPFHTIRNLAAFLWIFEPQLNMLHAEHRQNDVAVHCRSTRRNAFFSWEQFQESGKYPSVYEGAVQIMSYKDADALVGDTYGGRDRAYNFTGFSDRYSTSSKATLEFRQHAGTLDGDAVVNWVEVCHGIVDYIQHISPVEMDRLVQFSKLETWEETGDPKADAEMEAKFGPVLAKGKFTVIDLLRYLKLDAQAEYYSQMVQEKIEYSLSSSDTKGSESPDFFAAGDFFDEFLQAGSDTSEGKDQSTTASST